MIDNPALLLATIAGSILGSLAIHGAIWFIRWCKEQDIREVMNGR